MSQEGSVSRSTTTKEKGAPSMRKFSREHPVNLAPLRTCDSNKLPLFPTHHLFPLSGSGDRFPPLHSLGSVADGETPELQTNIVYKTVITELLSDSQKNAGRVDEKLFPLTECEDEINVKVPFEPGMLRAKAKTRTERSIPHYAEKIFDAPNIREDFYLNVVDWSYKDVLAVGLDQDLFVCTLRRGDIIGEVQRLGEYDETNFISAVRFSATEDILAIALNSEDLELWNVSERKRLQTLCSSGYRVGCLSWNGNILTAGDKGGQICHHDMRLKSSIVAKYVAHKDDVCGLEWSPNGRYLASGGNDNRVQIYSHMAMKATPVLSLSDHQAAVKVTGLLWSEYYNELASCNGLPSNRVVIWTYPHLNILKRLKEHSNRILSMVMSPCGEYVLTAAADESIRVWHVFDKSGKYRVNCRASTGSAEESLSELMKLVELE
ncbi:WD domain, G-beta repeat protein [Trichuris suis]|nr:WD domain, G-beta repeat protein [Trichuris suis]